MSATRNGDEHLHDPELLELAWTMLLQEWDVLKKMCGIAARKDRLRRDTWEEAMSEVAAKLPQFLWSYDPSKGMTLRSYVIACSRWYLHKLFVSERGGSRNKKVQRALKCMHPMEQMRRSVTSDGHRELFDWSEVQFVLDRIHPFHRSVLQLYYMSGLTYEEIGGVLECSKSAARKRVIEALDAAREQAQALRDGA